MELARICNLTRLIQAINTRNRRKIDADAAFFVCARGIATLRTAGPVLGGPGAPSQCVGLTGSNLFDKPRRTIASSASTSAKSAPRPWHVRSASPKKSTRRRRRAMPSSFPDNLKVTSGSMDAVTASRVLKLSELELQDVILMKTRENLRHRQGAPSDKAAARQMLREHERVSGSAWNRWQSANHQAWVPPVQGVAREEAPKLGGVHATRKQEARTRAERDAEGSDSDSESEGDGWDPNAGRRKRGGKRHRRELRAMAHEAIREATPEQLAKISEEKRVSRATTGAFMGGLAAPEGMPSHLTSARSAAEVETLLAEQLFRARHVVQILRVAEQSGAMFSANNLATALYRAAGLGLRVRSGGVPVLPPVLSTVAGPHDPDAAVHGLLERSLAKVPLMRPRDAAVMAYAVSLMGVGTETTTFPARGYRSARRGAAAVPWEIAGDGGPDERAKEGELAGDRDDQADRPGSSPPGGPIGERRVGGSASLVYSLRDALLDRLEAIVGDGAPAAESDVMAEAARVWPGAVDAPHSRSVPVYPSPQKSLARLADVVREVQRSGGCPALAAVPEWDVWGGFSLEEAALEPCLERSSLGLAAGAVARLSAAGKRRGLKAMLAAEACWAAERGNIDNRTLATVLAWSRQLEWRDLSGGMAPVALHVQEVVPGLWPTQLSIVADNLPLLMRSGGAKVAELPRAIAVRALQGLAWTQRPESLVLVTWALAGGSPALELIAGAEGRSLALMLAELTASVLVQVGYGPEDGRGDESGGGGRLRGDIGEEEVCVSEGEVEEGEGWDGEAGGERTWTEDGGEERRGGMEGGEDGRQGIGKRASGREVWEDDDQEWRLSNGKGEETREVEGRGGVEGECSDRDAMEKAVLSLRFGAATRLVSVAGRYMRAARRAAAVGMVGQGGGGEERRLVEMMGGVAARRILGEDWREGGGDAEAIEAGRRLLEKMRRGQEEETGDRGRV